MSEKSRVWKVSAAVGTVSGNSGMPCLSVIILAHKSTKRMPKRAGYTLSGTKELDLMTCKDAVRKHRCISFCELKEKIVLICMNDEHIYTCGADSISSAYMGNEFIYMSHVTIHCFLYVFFLKQVVETLCETLCFMVEKNCDLNN